MKQRSSTPTEVSQKLTQIHDNKNLTDSIR